MLLSGNYVPEAALSDENPAVFSLELGDDLVEMRDWLHGFAESVIRPAAAEWDEREGKIRFFGVSINDYQQAIVAKYRWERNFYES